MKIIGILGRMFQYLLNLLYKLPGKVFTCVRFRYFHIVLSTRKLKSLLVVCVCACPCVCVCLEDRERERERVKGTDKRKKV